MLGHIRRNICWIFILSILSSQNDGWHDTWCTGMIEWPMGTCFMGGGKKYCDNGSSLFTIHRRSGTYYYYFTISYLRDLSFSHRRAGSTQYSPCRAFVRQDSCQWTRRMFLEEKKKGKRKKNRTHTKTRVNSSPCDDTCISKTYNTII